jgi:hypothetical protein
VKSKVGLLAFVQAMGCYAGHSGAASDGGSTGAGDAGTASETGGETEGDESLTCEMETPRAGPSRIRRLTPTQYQNTVRDLFGDPTITVSLHEDDDLFASALAVERFDVAATELGPRGVALLGTLPACAEKNEACAEAFIDNFGGKAFRRPITEDERQWLRSTFAAANEQFVFDDAITVVTQVILGSPQFLYLAPVGHPVPDSPEGLRQLDDYELAARLSYFLWNTMPDEALFAAAAEGLLATGDGEELRNQATRMLDSDRARSMAHEFVSKWFQLNGGTVHFSLEETPKNAELYPAVDEDLRAAMRLEVGALMEKVVFEGGAIGELFTDTSAYVNGPLAELYGVEGGPTGADEWAWVSLDPNERAGLLTRAAFAAVYSSAKAQSPIRRGTFILREILCFDQPPPPPDVDNRPVEDIEDDETPKTIREMTDLRTQAPECQGCHNIINSIGYAFEHYDAIGTFRTEEIESGLPIDASSELFASGNADGPTADAIAMSQALAQSEVATQCLTERWFEHALRRDPDLLDDCSLEVIQHAAGGTSSMRDLLLAVIGSDAFSFVNPGEDSP